MRKGVVLVLRSIISRRIQAFRWYALRGGLSKGSQPVLTRVLDKTTENSERLDRQARPGFEPGTSRLPVLSVIAVPLVGLLICWELRLSQQPSPGPWVNWRSWNASGSTGPITSVGDESLMSTTNVFYCVVRKMLTINYT